MKKIQKILALGITLNLLTCSSIEVEAANTNNEDNISAISEKIAEIKQIKVNDYDVEKAVEALYKELKELKESKSDEVIDKDITIQKLEKELASEKSKNLKYKQEDKLLLEKYISEARERNYDDISNNNVTPKIEYSRPVENTNKYMINPTPSSKVNNYIQDGANAQGYARMEFAYAPQQVYKIYCKIGYLTDLEFKQGEQITYVGGGDTAQWLIDKAIVADTPHLYIKPIANNIATNIIVNTSGGHVYQILLNSGSWYNPMISWNYGNEDLVTKKMINNEYNNDEVYPLGKGLNVKPENINFSYKIKSKKGNKLPSWAPISVFYYGKKTYIKFEETSEKLPALFIKEKDSKNLSFANYRQKNNLFIIDKIFDVAQLQVSNKSEDIIIIEKE